MKERCAAFACVLGMLVAPPQAHADGPIIEVVTLNDGSIYQGELVEKVTSDHITIKLASGELKTFAWIDVQATHEGGAPATVAPSTTVPTASQDRIVRNWPEPNRQPPVFSRPHLLLGLVGGVGGPEGYAGVSAGWDPNSWFGVEVSAGSGGTFGPALAETLRFALPILSVRVGLGVGLSQNLVGSKYTDEGAPKIADWLNLETFGDVAIGRHFLFRYTMGWGFLLNSFGALCPKGMFSTQPGCSWDVPITPATAGAGWAFDLYGTIRLVWLVDL